MTPRCFSLYWGKAGSNLFSLRRARPPLPAAGLLVVTGRHWNRLRHTTCEVRRAGVCSLLLWSPLIPFPSAPGAGDVTQMLSPGLWRDSHPLTDLLPEAASLSMPLLSVRRSVNPVVNPSVSFCVLVELVLIRLFFQDSYSVYVSVLLCR